MKTAIMQLYDMLDDGKISDIAEIKEYYLMLERKQIDDAKRQAVEVALNQAANDAKCIVIQAQDDSVMAIVNIDSILNCREEIFKKLGM